MSRSCTSPRAVRRLIGISMALVASFATLQSPASADESGWVLTQKSLLFGDMYLYVSAQGFKFVNPKAGLNFVTRSPSWDVVMFNDKTKVCFSSSMSTFKKEAGANFNQKKEELARASWQRGSVSNIAGLKASQYVASNIGAAPVKPGRKAKEQLTGADYWVSEQIHVPPQLSDLVSSMYGLPNTMNVPLRLTYTTRESAGKVALDTYYSKACAIPASYYTVPQGYRQVKSSVEVMADEDTKQILDDMNKDFGSSTPSSGGGNNSKPITNEDLDKFLNKFKKH